MDRDQKIQVIVRKRPLNSKEKSKGDVDVLSQRSSQSLVIKEEKLKVDLTKYIEEHQFTFDGVFNEEVNNQELYQATVQPIIQAAFQGAKVTCFAYGQTGSGKTYTMMGEENTPGLYLLAANDLFYFRDNLYPNFKLTVSFYEIYCGKLHDLLNDRHILHVREDAKQNVNIVGLQYKPVTDVKGLMQLINFGLNARTTGQTGANEDSSRSHGVLEISLRSAKNVIGKVTFIDLAGSERGADVRDSDSKTRFDGAEINKSLLALKECIRALDQDKKHTPFRGSKLTLVLKDSFMGNCRTVMICNVSPGLSSCEHTLNSLRYADRVKELKKGGGTGAGKDLSNILMLPRQNTNVARYAVDTEEYEENKPKNLIPKGRPPLPISKPKIPEYECLELENMADEHEKLIGKILEEEENLIQTHKKTVDDMVDAIKVQMALLSEVDKPGSNVDLYVSELDKVLAVKEEMIHSLRQKIQNFGSLLKQEENMSIEFISRKSAMNIFDLKSSDDDLLIGQI